MSFVWSFSTSGAAIEGRVACWPIVPGTLRIDVSDGLVSKVLVDNGDGTLSGDGSGTINYSSGYFGADFTAPLPASGTSVLADYQPVEGGCSEDCDKCPTHFLRLDITPQTISGASDFTLSDAWRRLFVKLERDVKPIHVRFLPEESAESFVVSISHRFDVIAADQEPLDTSGLHTLFDDTSW